MKRIYLLSVLSIILAACSSDEPNDGSTNQTLVTMKVQFIETSQQDPSWRELLNTTPECIAWKEAHAEYFRGHATSSNNVEKWIWFISYENYPEAQIIADIDEFVQFSLMPPPDANYPSGYDVYQATAIYDDYYVLHAYDQYANVDDGNKTGWLLTFEESGSIIDSQLEAPDVYYEWANAHSQYLVDEYRNDSRKSWRNKWEMVIPSFSNDVINETVIPFINMGYSNGKSCCFFIVRVRQYGTNKVMRFYKTSN